MSERKVLEEEEEAEEEGGGRDFKSKNPTQRCLEQNIVNC